MAEWLKKKGNWLHCALLKKGQMAEDVKKNDGNALLFKPALAAIWDFPPYFQHHADSRRRASALEREMPGENALRRALKLLP